jgi:hypothetical protein
MPDPTMPASVGGAYHKRRIEVGSEVVDGDVDWLLVGEREAHPGEHGPVVAERRLRRAVLVAESAEVAPDKLAERCRAVALVLHGFADDPCRLAERQARSSDNLEVSSLRRRSGRASLRPC